MVHYTFQRMSTITKLSPEVIKYYMNITSQICAIARLQRDVQVWTVHRHSRVYKRKTREAHRGAWKDRASDGLLRIHASAAPLWSATGGTHTLQAPWPGHEDPGESDETPQASGDTKARWRAEISISVSIKPNHNLALKTVSWAEACKQVDVRQEVLRVR